MNGARKRALAAIAAGALALVPAAAGADVQANTHVDTLNAAVGGGAIAVSGTATFVSIPTQVGLDGTGDAAVAGLGADVTSLKISRPSAGSANMKFEMGIADQPVAPVSGGPMIVWNWPLLTDDTDNGYYLEARRVSASPFFPNANANPQFMLVHNHADGFHEHGPITGTMADGVVSWTVSLSAIQASTASTIGTSSGCAALGSTASVPGGFILCANAGGDGAFLDVESYEIPKARVQLGLAPAGTPESAVTMSETATVNATTGAYSVAIAKPAPGSYILVAKACFGSDNCGLSSTTITV